jgi:hypothetical protein
VKALQKALGTLIAWLAQSAGSPIRVDEANQLINIMNGHEWACIVVRPVAREKKIECVLRAYLGSDYARISAQTATGEKWTMTRGQTMLKKPIKKTAVTQKRLRQIAREFLARFIQGDSSDVNRAHTAMMTLSSPSYRGE